MKKITILLVPVLIICLFAGCKEVKNETTSNTRATTTQSKKEDTQTIDGVTLTCSSKIEAIKGDRTADNHIKEMETKYANGSDKVKAADYKKIVATVDIKNNTDKAIEIEAYDIGAKLQDGYMTYEYIGTEDSVKVQSEAQGKYEVYYIVPDDIKADKIKVSFFWVEDYEKLKMFQQDPESCKKIKEGDNERYDNGCRIFELYAEIPK